MAFEGGTPVGNLDSPVRARVDATGAVSVPGLGWRLDWWIGAEDRWHQPRREAAVRQELVASSPVVASRVRIPTGDAVARAYGARGPRGEDLLVLEVENDSKVPVALAVVIEPDEPDGAVGDLSLAGTELRIDDTSVWLARSPGRFALSVGADERTAGEVVLTGDAEPVRAATVSCPRGAAQGVLLFPLAHTATLRMAVPLDGTHRAIDPADLPSAQQVASGWSRHAGQGARVEVPDRQLREAIATARRFLLLLDDPADDTLASIAARWSYDEVLPAGDPLRIAGLVGAWARGQGPDDDATGYAALPAIAQVLQAMGEPRAAADVRAIHRNHPVPDAVAEPGPDDGPAFLLAVRGWLVGDHEHPDELALSPVVPPAWLGLGWEVHDLPTAHGRISYAIRWHGDRPALLWELDRRDGGPDVRLSTPGLDPSWSTTAARGEALLAPVPVPERPTQRRGLSIPVTIEPMRGGS